jgi:hypothetical protein
MDYPYFVRHLSLGTGCGQIAFYLTRKVEIGDCVIAGDVVYLDGTIGKDGEVMMCSSCNNPIEVSNGNIPYYWVERNG